MKILLLLLSFLCFSQEIKKSKEELEGEQVNFNNIKRVIKKDFLTESVQKKKKKYKSVKRKRKRKVKELYNYPDENDFWTFLSEYWLIKNAQKLKWDFEKPDYGIETAVEKTFETFGYFEKRFKVLLVNTPELTHFSLPTKDHYIFLISVPFMRTMDLTKREISIMVMEDYIRNQKGYLRNYVLNKELKKIIGGNFKGKPVNVKAIEEAIKRFDYFVYNKGYSFQQQFEVTSQLSSLLKSDLKIWNAYLSLLNKIDRLVKTNELYKNYTKIYPSPELQIKWILPEKQVL